MSDEKAIRTIIFDGDESKWRMWKLKFLAKASAMEYSGVLEGVEEIPPDDTVLNLNMKERRN